MHTFHNVSHKGILSDADSVARVLDIIRRFGKVSDNGSDLQQTARAELYEGPIAKRGGFFSFLHFAGEPIRRWDLTAPRAE